MAARDNLMKWGDELVKLRRFLRDPRATIWTDELLAGLYNDVAREFALATEVLEKVAVLRVPSLYQGAYLFDWEWSFLGQTSIQALNLHREAAFCHQWEAQQLSGITPDVSEWGAHFIQPWEAFMGLTPADPIKMQFPPDFQDMKWMAYDEKPLSATTRKKLQSQDPSYMQKMGVPLVYYPVSDVDYSFVLYPIPEIYFNNEVDAHAGAAIYAEGDTQDISAGTVAYRSGDSDAGAGVAFDIIDTVGNLFMVYRPSPTPIAHIADEIDFPPFLVKYIGYGVISRAYAANTDGRIQSLGNFWKQRYDMGVQFTRRYILSRHKDRDYRLTTHGRVLRHKTRHPRLPSHYPATP